ncbi:hypothetical protein NDU88_004950, partial [Pleurodeles waltl]
EAWAGFMSECWRILLCKETESCGCFTTKSRSCDDEENDHQIVVSDILQLVTDQELESSTQ